MNIVYTVRDSKFTFNRDYAETLLSSEELSLLREIANFVDMPFYAVARRLDAVLTYFPSCFGIEGFERLAKAVSRSVEPGSYIEFLTSENEIIRYVFLFDTVERWTVPHILYAKKEEI